MGRKAGAAAAAAAACLLLASCGLPGPPPGPIATGTTSAPPLAPPSGTGAYGYVTAGPTCPVERSDQPCPPQPVSARVEAHVPRGGAVASTRSDSSGRYALDLPPGSYVLVVGAASGWPHCPDTPVTVERGSAARADVSCDTGIR
ncbi:carboxypeptidase-like regulatory domain-containing protein [Sinomonas mesophila]|uniref:carboxypeptidase-like regulatory domain-containing protein n=1 Tax=Sinomonas mesophila TaxID=1531955 RepID=UPI0009870311|nr:carboxypeptidase-like regulatory domain-containing protein [Sinomonas mesophila]